MTKKPDETTSLNTSSVDLGERQPFVPSRKDDMFHRFRYYQTLNAHSAHGSGRIILAPPPHVLPPNLFVPILMHTEAGTQSSLLTIFSLWSTMLGSSMLAMPWAWTNAGLVGGLGVAVVCALICYWSGTVVLDQDQFEDFSDAAREYFGRWAQVVLALSSITVLLGACIVYYTFLSDSVYSIVDSFRYMATSDKSAFVPETHSWKRDYVPLYLTLVLFPLTNFRNITALLKFSSFAVCFVVTVMSFMFYACVREGLVLRETTPIADSSFFYLAGVMLVGMFIHNSLLPITKNVRYPEHKKRDSGIAFFLVLVTYSAVGALGYVAFYRSGQPHGGIPQDFLSMFPRTDVYALIARIALTCQLTSVYPILAYIIRIQVFGLAMNTQYPGFLYVLALNAVLSGLGIVFAIWYPHVGTILRFVGAFVGLLYIFIFPVAVRIYMLRKDGLMRWWRTAGMAGLVTLGCVTFVFQFVP